MILVRLFAAVLALVSAPAHARGPLVLAAASLQESLNAAADAWAAKGLERPVISFAASSALARQIEMGAKADLFLSADEAWMNRLADKRLIRAETRRDLLANALVLVGPKRGAARVTIRPGFPLAPLLGPGGRLAMADPDSVPAGKYGCEALTQLGVWPSVARRITRSENVRAALALVARGAAPLGIVYATDARAEPGVRTVAVFPLSSHRVITYPLARLARSTHPKAEGFRAFLASRQGLAIFRRFGFGTIG